MSKKLSELSSKEISEAVHIPIILWRTFISEFMLKVVGVGLRLHA